MKKILKGILNAFLLFGVGLLILLMLRHICEMKEVLDTVTNIVNK